jgi:hypothetical protein
MFTIVIVTVIAIAVAVLGHLVTVVRGDRAATPPRSHTHELDPKSARLLRVI